jgi:hypothetical protein
MGLVQHAVVATLVVVLMVGLSGAVIPVPKHYASVSPSKLLLSSIVGMPPDEVLARVAT